MHAWSESKHPLRLQELQVSKDDPDPKALCCYGMLDAQSKQMRLRFVDGRPVSQVTIDFLEWLCQQVASQGQRTLVLIWDNASWHVSKLVKTWIYQHNQAALQAQREGKLGIQVIPCWLPTKSRLSQPHRALLGAWQTGDCRTCSLTHCSRGYPARM